MFANTSLDVTKDTKTLFVKYKGGTLWYDYKVDNRYKRIRRLPIQ